MAKKTNYEFGDLTKIQKECLALIESLGIYELRALARVFGDNAPTTLKRNDHINIVMNKIISGEELSPIPLRQGRPYKELSNIEGILNELSQLTGQDYNLKTSQTRPVQPLQKVVTFRQMEEDIVNKKMFPIEVRGIVCTKNDNDDLYFINQDNSKQILIKKDSKLKPFDFVTGTAVIMNEDKEYVLDTIKTINYTPASNYHEIVDEYYTTIPDKKLEISNKTLLLGTRYLINGSFLDNQEKIQEIVTGLKNNQIVTLALIPNVLYENNLTIKSLGFNNAFILKYDEKPINICQTLTNFIEHITRLQKLGLNVAIFVQDIPVFANALDYANKSTTLNHADSTVETIKNLIMLAKAGSNNKHTTIFTTYDDSDMFDQLFVSSVYKVSKKI